jgi:hypothetical protein
MQDAVSSASLLHENFGRTSRISETDYEIQSTGTTEQQQPVPLRLPSIRSNHPVSPKITHRNGKTRAYDPPASGRESWWRVTIKVDASNIDLQCEYFYI